jgi:GntR family transcriptional regulator
MARTSVADPLPPPSRLADIASIAAAFVQTFVPGVPRYLQLQNAITQLIRSGELRSGAQLPPDQQLTGALDVSLGTVQKAFSGLASDGWISREHGRGTFIAQPRQPVTELWHYRFRDPQNDKMLPVYSNGARSRATRTCATPWATTRWAISKSSG